MNRSWESKKATAESVSNSHIDGLYSIGLANGAHGGKVSGAGGGGFIMFITGSGGGSLWLDSSAVRRRCGAGQGDFHTFTGVESWIAPA